MRLESADDLGTVLSWTRRFDGRLVVIAAVRSALFFACSVGAPYAESKSAQTICDLVRGSVTQISDPTTPGPVCLGNSLGELTWKSSTVTLDGAPMQESDFDFYNDGNIDRVYKIEFNDRYMIGSAVLVQHGRLSARLDVAVQNPLPDPDAGLIACQMAAGDIPLNDCPPLSQKSDDASFPASKPGSTTMTQFAARYTDLEPYRFDGITYLVTKSFKRETRRYVAVLKPVANRMLSHVCIFRARRANRKN